MTGSRSFKDLIVWQRAIELTSEIYTMTKQFPRQEEYALTSQLRRAAVSIPSNIAEGSKRGTAKDFMQFLRIAAGSAAELETQLIVVCEVYPNANAAKAAQMLSEVQSMLAVLILKLKT